MFFSKDCKLHSQIQKIYIIDIIESDCLNLVLSKDVLERKCNLTLIITYLLEFGSTSCVSNTPNSSMLPFLCNREPQLAQKGLSTQIPKIRNDILLNLFLNHTHTHTYIYIHTHTYMCQGY